MRAAYLFLILTCISCSFNKLAVDQLAQTLDKSSVEIQKESSWDHFHRSIPGSLQVTQSLLLESPDNKTLLALLTKGFAAYGYIVADTLHLRNRLLEREESASLEAAVHNFSKSLQFGFRYLKQQGLSLQGLQKAAKANKSQSYISEHLDSSNRHDLESAFYTGTAWLMMANVKRDHAELLSQITYANELITWVCSKKPNFERGLCPSLQAVYHLARPKMFGGKPELAKNILLKSMKRYKENLLIPVIYMEWYLIPFEKKKEYLKLSSKLKSFFEAQESQFFIPGKASNRHNSKLNLYNAMAAKRLRILNGLAKELL